MRRSDGMESKAITGVLDGPAYSERPTLSERAVVPTTEGTVTTTTGFVGAAAGALAGAIAGPVGAVAGAALGAVCGAVAGRTLEQHEQQDRIREREDENVEPSSARVDEVLGVIVRDRRIA